MTILSDGLCSEYHPNPSPIISPTDGFVPHTLRHVLDDLRYDDLHLSAIPGPEFIGSLIPNPTTRCFITYRFMKHSVKAHRKPNVIKMASRHAMMFPFAAIVGQDLMKKALILNVIDPGIGGVLIKGEKGTAKSTTIRSLEQVLPKKEVVKGCPFHCDPRRPEGFCPYCAEKAAAGEKLETETVPTDVIELPLSATEDRVAGTLDLEAVLQTGKKKFEPGILAQANGNLLYVDEINLLEDYIVDMLLDSAAMGTRAECEEFAAMVRRSVPERFLRSISAFYPNRRGGFSTEGRIYIKFAEIPAGTFALPEVSA